MRGGKRPNSGRKPGPTKVRVMLRLTPAQALLLKMHGGSKWVESNLPLLTRVTGTSTEKDGSEQGEG